jgi:hypothetical protein
MIACYKITGLTLNLRIFCAIFNLIGTVKKQGIIELLQFGGYKMK